MLRFILIILLATLLTDEITKIEKTCVFFLMEWKYGTIILITLFSCKTLKVVYFCLSELLFLYLGLNKLVKHQFYASKFIQVFFNTKFFIQVKDQNTKAHILWIIVFSCF